MKQLMLRAYVNERLTMTIISYNTLNQDKIQLRLLSAIVFLLLLNCI